MQFFFHCRKLLKHVQHELFNTFTDSIVVLPKRTTRGGIFCAKKKIEMKPAEDGLFISGKVTDD